MRKLLAVATVAGLLGSVGLAGEASATPSLSLQWLSGTPSGGIVVAGGGATLRVVLDTDVPLLAATIMVGIVDTSADAPKITAATNTPPPSMQPATFGISPPAPNGTQVGAFGGLTLTPLAPGTYTLGEVTIQMGAALGLFAVEPFQRPQSDDWSDSGGNVVVPVLSGAIFGTIPEPGTAALLGLGLAGLVAVSRQSRA